MMSRTSIVVFFVAALVGGTGCSQESGTEAETESADLQTCSDAQYASWLSDGLRPALKNAMATPTDDSIAALERAAATVPCAASETSYTAWWPYWSAALSARTQRVQAATDPGGGRTEAQFQARALVGGEARVLRALAKSAPRRGNLAAYGAWFATYTEHNNEAVQIFGFGRVPAVTILEEAFVVNSREAELLELDMLVKPTVAGEGAITPWVPVFSKLVGDAYNGTSPASEQRSTAITRFIGSQPAVTSEKDYLIWFQAYDAVRARAIATELSSNASTLSAWESSVPKAAGGDSAYLGWLGKLLDSPTVEALKGAPGFARTRAEKSTASLLRVKPCGGTEANAKHAEISGRVASVPSLATLLSAAKPTMCTP
jgi:hypothetical protein